MNGKTESDNNQRERGRKIEGRIEKEKERKEQAVEKGPGKEPENYGRYFGVCFSYHNAKACSCGSCPSYPGSGNMFCARGKSGLKDRRFKDKILPEKKAGCLCRDCGLYRKFRFEGQYFCRE